MTPQEAIEAIKLKDIHIESGALRITAFFQGLSKAKEALEKQIPKKVTECGGDWFSCPECKTDIVALDELETHKHCLACGQALDWSDTE